MTLTTSLYVHIPWCIRKCPYCDFNSHNAPALIDEESYIKALMADFKQDLNFFPAREIHTLFIGGGTPSLFSAKAFALLFKQLNEIVSFSPDIEITLEANPGTMEQHRFANYRKIGINRLSLGIQSFNATHLQRLGRIHDDRQAQQAIESAYNAGFDNINIDLMYGLPKQSAQDGLADLRTAINYKPKHLSWYQLTLEPNTVFYKHPPALPAEEEIALLEEDGLALLTKAGFDRYEISAFSQPNQHARHNINYWLFGDYYGIGAGAHGKLTFNGHTYRTQKYRQPQDYLVKSFLVSREIVDANSLIFEFMLNTTRLRQPIPYNLFSERTGLDFNSLKPFLEKASQQKLITLYPEYWQITSLGCRYTNDLQALFLID